MVITDTKGVEDIDARYRALIKRRETTHQNKVRVEAELQARKRALKEAMGACEKAGWDPNNLQEEVRRAREVLDIKMDNFEADLDTADNILKPMLKEIG